MSERQAQYGHEVFKPHDGITQKALLKEAVELIREMSYFLVDEYDQERMEKFLLQVGRG